MQQTWPVAVGRTARRRELGITGVVLAAGMLFAGLGAVSESDASLISDVLNHARFTRNVPYEEIGWIIPKVQNPHKLTLSVHTIDNFRSRIPRALLEGCVRGSRRKLETLARGERSTREYRNLTRKLRTGLS
jgi:hypothetical protein